MITQIIKPIAGLALVHQNKSNGYITLIFKNDGSYKPTTHPIYGEPKVYVGDLVEFWFKNS